MIKFVREGVLLTRCSECLKLRKVVLAQNVLGQNSQELSTSAKRSKKGNHYETLGISNKASNKEIREAFVKLSKQLHPDLNPGDPRNHDNFIKLNEAYTVLNKPSSKREYDFTLSHQFYMQEHLARSGYGQHTPGGGAYPGMGPRPGEGVGNSGHERVFWDETIWEMRDKSKDADAFYSEDSYYGIKGVKRQSNGVVVAGCFAIMALGCLYFFVGYKWSNEKRKAMLEQDRKNIAHLIETRQRARERGNSIQIALLKENMQADQEQRDLRMKEAVNRR